MLESVNMKRAFTLIELIFSIVVLGILAMIGAEILSRFFERYAAARDTERAQSDLRRTLDILAARLSYRVKNSVVAYDIDTDSVSPIYQPEVTPTPSWSWNLEDFEALQWVGIAYESQRGASTGGSIVEPGWSAIGLRLTGADGAGANQFRTPLSNLRTVALGIETTLAGANPFDIPSPKTVLIFAGGDWRGETPAGNSASMKHLSWNWINGGAGHTKSSYFQVTLDAASETDFTITPLYDAAGGDSAAYHPPSYSGANNTPNYFLARSAYAVWVDNGELKMAYDFRPWNDEAYDDVEAKTEVLLGNVTKFLFQESGGVLRLRLCVQASDWAAMVGPGEVNEVQFCRERSVL
ncbi:MAG: type II secretion system GspH family protein [Helicobacteraceae bacterium]|jgi:prepilin-type N-terminal cleavage/methylation domain-containing protein|nr:type II secretion system GspH family protein [Helicobacteraceae bacterium]